jgi:Golgi nucleoside diphosphatase
MLRFLTFEKLSFEDDAFRFLNSITKVSSGKICLTSAYTKPGPLISSLLRRPRPCPEKEWVKEDLEPVTHALFL